MIEKNWSNSAICRIIIQKTNNIDVNSPITNTISEPLNITINDGLIVIFLNSELEHNIVNKIIVMYCTKYNINFNQIAYIYIQKNIDEHIMKNILNKITAKYILTFNVLFIKSIITTYNIQQRGDILQYENKNILYTIHPNVLKQSNLYTHIIKLDLKNFFDHITKNEFNIPN